MAQQYYWTIDEINDLIKHWPNTPNYSTNKRNIFKCNSKAKDLSLTKSYNALIIEAKTKSNKCKWCNIEDEILTNEWPYVLNYSFGNRSIGSCNDRAIKLGLVKMKEIQDEVDYNERIRKENVYKKRVEIVVYRNKNILGRNLSNEELKIIASKYKTKQEFKFYDYCAYGAAVSKNILDEIGPHLLNEKINIPQTMLFKIVKVLFPNDEIKYNDRKTIYPKEIDVYNVSLKIGFEYDGVNFHSSEEDKINDIKKDELCKSLGIKLYRIKEIDKSKPLPHILHQLSEYGFDISKINKQEILNEIFKSITDLNEIKIITESYSDYSLFYKENKDLVSKLRKYNLLNDYIKHMTKPVKMMSDDEVYKIIENMILIDDMFKYGNGLYLRVWKSENIKIQEKRNTLLTKQQARKMGLI